MEEEWKTISKFPDYAVSNFGNIKRIVDAPGSRFRAGTQLRPALKRGYPQVTLFRGHNKFYRNIHRLVLEEFVGEPYSSDLQCNHKNGDKADNRVENLEWVTASENRYHSVGVLGKRAARGEDHGLAKLTNAQVRRIKEILNGGEKNQRELAEEYGVDPSSISDIKTGVHWAHIS